MAAIDPEALGDLRGELARGRDDKHARRPAPGLPAARQALDDRQRERGRLAGARLGPAEEVAPFEEVRDRLRLDRRRDLVPFIGHRAEKLLLEAELGECHGELLTGRRRLCGGVRRLCGGVRHCGFQHASTFDSGCVFP